MTEIDAGPLASRRPQTIRRTLTDTPLARLHERRVSKKQIDWKSFARGRYPDAALALAFDAQRHLAMGEYGAIALFSRIAASLAVNGAPFDLLTAAASVPADEARHADLAVRMAAVLAGCDPSEITLALDRAAIERQAGALDLESLDHAMTEVAAISETLAAALLGGCARQASDPVPRALFASLVADEIHHARIGWYYLAWRAPQWTRPERQRVADRAGGVVVEIERRFGRGRDAPRGAVKAADALGVLGTKAQRRIVRQVMEDEIVPALDTMGLGASHAWNGRERLA